MINDIEDLLRSIQAFSKANLNTQIIAINTAKTDFDIDQIKSNDEKYVFAGDLVDIPNNSFVNHTIVQIVPKINGNDIISIVTLMVEVAFDNPKKANTYFTSVRYMEALYDTFLEYEPSTNEVDGLEITRVLPAAIIKNKRDLVVSGIEFSLAIS